MKKIHSIILVLLAISLFSPSSVLAQICTPPCDPVSEVCTVDPGNAFQTYCAPKPGATQPGVPQDVKNVVGSITTPGQIDSSPDAINNYIPTIVNGFFFIGIIALLAYLVYGGVKWIMSGGDPKALAAARDTLMHAVVGFILLGISYAITQIFNILLGGVGYSRFEQASSPVQIHICGACPPNLSYDACRAEMFADPSGPAKCNAVYTTLDAAAYNSLPDSTKAVLCKSLGECDRGCKLNHDLYKSYKLCRPI